MNSSLKGFYHNAICYLTLTDSYRGNKMFLRVTLDKVIC